jgi:PAS domain S-box-containing protein
MTIAPIPANETERLVALETYDISGSQPDSVFDDLTKLAAHICQAPIALISLVGKERQCFRSCIGLEATGTPRDISFCAHVIVQAEFFVVRDALCDPRFADNPLVTAEPHIRFYAGAPLITSGGLAIGTICVVDHVPRDLTPAQKDALLALSRLVVNRMELHRAMAAKEKGEAALRQAATLQKAILEGADYSIISTREDGVILTFNAAAERMLGYTAAEVVGRLTPGPFHDAQELAQRAAELSRELGRPIQPGFEVFVAKAQLGAPEEREWSYVRKDGSRFPVMLSVTALRGDAGRVIGFLGIARDITERKLREAALRQAKEATDAANIELARANRLKDEFLANMSHELRTPLNAILGMSEALQETVLGPLTEKQARSLQVIHESGTHLLSLINDILDLSKIEAGKVELEIGEVNVESVCNASLCLVKETAHRKQLQVSFSPDDRVKSFRGDERRIKQILVNLLSNAVKFTPAGGSIGLEIMFSPNPGAVSFSVSDTGIGIAQQDVAKLFQPFVQLDSGLARHHQGTGLGLVLVRRLAELHGGSVKVESKADHGTRFTITLPTNSCPKGEPDTVREAQNTPAVPVQCEDASSQQPLILLAEDNEVNILTFTTYLEAKGYRVRLARNGTEALELARMEKPQLILMDIQMPGMDGLQAIRRIREDDELKETPIIALTALAMPGDRDRCLAAGANEYLAKPVHLRLLVERVTALLYDEVHLVTK